MRIRLDTALDTIEETLSAILDADPDAPPFLRIGRDEDSGWWIASIEQPGEKQHFCGTPQQSSDRAIRSLALTILETV